MALAPPVSDQLVTTTSNTPTEYSAARPLTGRSIVGLGVGGMIGTGIFVMIGMAAHDKAGPAITLSLVVAAIACAAVAMCYAEFASAIPGAGSAYTYAFAAFGKLPAWLMGWNILFTYGIAAASVAQGWSHYLQSFIAGLGVRLPAIITAAPFDQTVAGRLTITGCYCDLPALFIALTITCLIVRGIRPSIRLNAAILCVKLGVIGLVIAVGAFYVKAENWRPFAPYGMLASAGADGRPAGMLAGAALMFYAFMGFEALAAFAEECRNPRRAVPLGVLSSVGICTAIYIAMAAVLIGMVRYDRISLQAPIPTAFRQVGQPWAEFAVSLGALMGITSVLLIILLTLPRVLRAMGRDRMLPPAVFAELHPRFNTPWRSMMLIGACVGVVGAFLPLRLLADLVTVATVCGYLAICLAVPLLRRRVSPGPFRAPLGLAVPVVGAGTCLLLLVLMPGAAWSQFAGWLAGGAVAYVAYVRHKAVAVPASTAQDGDAL